MMESTESHLHEVNWHAVSEAECLKQLGVSQDVSRQGLASSEVQQRRDRYGRNTLPHKPPTTVFEIAVRQFKSPLIYILAVAAVVSFAMGDVKDGGFICAVLVLNAVIGVYQEWKAERSSDALKKLLQIRATVRRNGRVVEVDSEEIVPGDIVLLESGFRVPADLRLLDAHALEIDESLLTGESLPVPKDPDWAGEAAVPVADRENMAFAGSVVARGRATAIAVETGNRTAVGRLAQDMTGELGGKPPLLVRMERFTRVIAVGVLLLAAGIGGLGMLVAGYSIKQMFLFAVALAVSAIPEGLPVAMTIALAVATTRMAHRGVIIRRLTAVEGLGSCTLIATDKTGTLTCNQLTVQTIVLPNSTRLDVSGEGFQPDGTVTLNGEDVSLDSLPALEQLVSAGVYCNEASLSQEEQTWDWHGDAVDVALLVLAEKARLNRDQLESSAEEVSRIPFEPDLRYAASIRRMGDACRIFVKGAPERVLEMCQLDASELQSCEASALQLAEAGYRVIAFAVGDADPDQQPEDGHVSPENLCFLGFVGMIDPLRPGAVEAIEQCKQAGVDVTMVTGDHRVTALAIARQLGLAERDDQVLTGAQLEELSPEQLRDAVHRVRVFARVAPHQKLQIVEASQAAGHFTAVTGDGVNDAPALRAANIGVAMGQSGTDVARESAEMVITDDNFSTIVAGIEEGRVAYDNIRKVIYLLISTGTAELVLMTLAVATQTPVLPLLPVQLLWLNLVTNGIQDVALAFEPSEGDVLKRKPRAPRERIFNRIMIERTLIAAGVMGIAGFLTFRAFLPHNPTAEQAAAARNILLLLMVLFENVHIGNCRSETKSAFVMSPLRSPILLIGTLTAFLLHVTVMHTPWGRSVLDTQPIPLDVWLLLLPIALCLLPAMELHKWYARRRVRSESATAH